MLGLLTVKSSLRTEFIQSVDEMMIMQKFTLEFIVATLMHNEVVFKCVRFMQTVFER